ncbi:Telomerase protein component 1, partial [Stegodyphus mimosarum]
MLAFVDKNGSVKVKKPLQKSYWYSLEGHSKPITSCSTNDNGELLSCSLDGSVSIWKIPENEPTTKFSHTFAVNGLIFSTSSNLALSADLHGSVILWKINASEKLPLIYAVKKTYVEGSIQGLSWLKENQFVCAVSQHVNSEDKYMLDVLSFKTVTMDEQMLYEIRVEMTHNFQDEISCVDACLNSNTIAVGLKSGECTVISPDCKRNLKVYADWIIGAKILNDILCVSLLDGGVKCFSVAEILKSKKTASANPMKIYQPAKSNGCVPYPSCLFCDTNGKIYCGDTLGWLHIYSEDSSPYVKKIHSDSITGICVLGSNIFTSSLDRTIKGWSSETLEQVCQFHSSVPISCLAKSAFCDISSDSDFLMFGATSGAVHLLKFKLALEKSDT